VGKPTRAVLRGGGGGNAVPLTRPNKRGRTYGTIVVNLETHRVIDVLPDRTAGTVATWLAAHPEIEIVSRDRAGAYAEVWIAHESCRKLKQKFAAFGVQRRAERLSRDCGL
jgi:transposase